MAVIGCCCAQMKTDDGAFIYVRYAGVRHGRPEVMARLAQGETVDPREYYFRVAPMFETGAERYSFGSNSAKGYEEFQKGSLALVSLSSFFAGIVSRRRSM